MNAQEFCYWLQGFGELHQGPPDSEQWEAIKNHLALVFQKVTPTVRFTQPDYLQYTYTDGGRVGPNTISPLMPQC